MPTLNIQIVIIHVLSFNFLCVQQAGKLNCYHLLLAFINFVLNVFFFILHTFLSLNSLILPTRETIVFQKKSTKN